jgi:hypothetical protein
VRSVEHVRAANMWIWSRNDFPVSMYVTHCDPFYRHCRHVHISWFFRILLRDQVWVESWRMTGSVSPRSCAGSVTFHTRYPLSLQTYGMQHCVLYYDSLSLSLSLCISISFYIYLYFYLWISISISISNINIYIYLNKPIDL